MKAWWPLDEQNGNVAEEVVGGHTGSLVSAPVHEAGEVCNALHFNGVDEWVEAPISNHAWVKHLSIDAWIKLDTLPPIGEQYPIVSYNQGAFVGEYSFYVQTAEDGQTYLGFIYCDCQF